MLQRQADAIRAVEHAVAAEIVDLKAVGFIPGFNHLRFQIHFKRNARLACTSLNSSSTCSSLRVTGSSWLLKLLP